MSELCRHGALADLCAFCKRHDLPVNHSYSGIVPELQKRIQELERSLKLQCDHAAELEKENAAWNTHVEKLGELIRDYAQHDNWRCTEYQECHCGLDDETDGLGIPRIPYPPKIRA